MCPPSIGAIPLLMLARCRKDEWMTLDNLGA